MKWDLLNLIDNQQLVNMIILERKKGRRTVFGRLLQVDPHQHTVLFYDDDQKKLLNLHFNEIDDIKTASSAPIHR